MGFYTPNFNLFCPQDSDFVDVNADVDNNMLIIDEAMFELLQTPVVSVPFSSIVAPTYTNKHVLSTWDGGLRVWDQHPQGPGGNAIGNWQNSVGAPSDWTPLAPLLLSPWVDVPSFSTYYRVVKEDLLQSGGASLCHVEFRGRIRQSTGYTAIVQNQVYQICKAIPNLYLPTVSNNGSGEMVRATMGNSPSSTTVWNGANVFTSGDFQSAGNYTFYLTFQRKCGVNGNNNQTNGNTENYLSLEGVKVLAAFGPNL